MPTQLASLQNWMHAVITHPDGVDAGAGSNQAQSQFDTAPERFEQIVTPSGTLTARQRLEIYQYGYFRRLLDCLGEMLPVLRHALGPELFEQFALEFLQSHPSRSYTLALLDDGFVRYLRNTRPDSDLPKAEREDWPDFIIDLATLEHGIRVTFDGPGAEGETLLDPATVADWSDAQLFDTVLQPVPCLSLASFRFPVRTYLLAVRRGEDPALPAPYDTFVAFNRRDFGVRLLEFERMDYDLLSGLASGRDIATAANDASCSDPTALRPLLVQFAEAGLFCNPYDNTNAIDASKEEHR